MIPWKDRTEEIANLLNPAFCGEVIRRCVSSYQNKKGGDINIEYELIFLILPIVLHNTTRSKINPRSRKQLHTWLQENQEVRIGFSSRVKQLIPYTKEAMSFLMIHGAIQFDDSGRVYIPNYTPTNIDVNTEIGSIYKSAEVLGKWFANAGTTPTIFTMWGVKP